MSATHKQYTPFGGGPPQWFEIALTWSSGSQPRLVRRALLAAAVSWLPLALFTAVHGDFANSFLLDLGAHTRFLVALPLLILAEPVCIPRLAAIARQFIDAGLVTEADRPRYDAAVMSSQQLMNSRVVEIVLPVLVYALVVLIVLAAPAPTTASWHGPLAPFAPSPAGWWTLLVSIPLLLLLLLSWLWRIWIWARFLWLMNRLPLQLDPAHSDSTGGLRFVGSSVEGFMPIGFIVGVIAAGTVARRVVYQHADPLQFKSVAIGVAIMVVVLCAGPLLIFLGRLIEERDSGMLQYSALGMRMGQRFKRGWLSPGARLDQEPVDMSVFTGTNAMYSIVGNAQAIRILPLELKSVGLLIVATLLPFVPVWLTAVPFAEIAKTLGAFLL
jgi:hypothetical protein